MKPFRTGLLILVIAYVSLVPYPFITGASVYGVPALRLVPLAACITLSLVTAYAYFTGAEKEALPLAFPLGMLAFVQLLSAANSIEPSASIGKAAFYFMTGPAIFFAASRLKASARTILWAVVAIGLISGLASIVEFFSGSVPFFADAYRSNNPYLLYEGLKGRSFGLLGHPVFMGGFFVLILPATYYALGTAKNAAGKVFATLCLAGGLAGLLLTFSRGAWAAAAVSAFVYYRHRVSWKKAVAALLVVAACMVGLAVGSGKVRDMLTSRDPVAEYVENAETTHRLKAYAITARVVGDVPLLGIGVGNYRTLYDKYREAGDDTRRTYATPDNMYLVTLAETGLAGLGLFVYILYSMRGLLSRGRASGADGALMLAALAALAGFCVDIFFFDGLYVEPLRIIFWSFTGLACGAAAVEDGSCPAP